MLSNIKKIGLSMLVAGALATSASAASEEKGVYVGVGSADFNDVSETVYTVGYGFTKTLDSKYVWGVDAELEYADIEGESMFGFGAEGKFGYNVLPATNVYGVIGAKMQDMDGYDAYGFGIGAGASYKINDSYSASVEYRTYDMEGSGGMDYDYDKVGVNLKYSF